jgi:hypothetical protein
VVAPPPSPSHIWAQPRPWGGGTYINITGQIMPGDEQRFAAVAASAVPPVYVRPSGPGGNVSAALAIGDMIAARGYNTMIDNGYECASACATIWASGYANHAMARSSSLLLFHSCYNYGHDGSSYDDPACNSRIIDHLLKWGFTRQQANWAVATPHWTASLATQPIGASLGLRAQYLSWAPGIGDYCRARLCIMVP